MLMMRSMSMNFISYRDDWTQSRISLCDIGGLPAQDPSPKQSGFVVELPSFCNMAPSRVARYSDGKSLRSIHLCQIIVLQSCRPTTLPVDRLFNGQPPYQQGDL